MGRVSCCTGLGQLRRWWRRWTGKGRSSGWRTSRGRKRKQEKMEWNHRHLLLLHCHLEVCLIQAVTMTPITPTTTPSVSTPLKDISLSFHYSTADSILLFLCIAHPHSMCRCLQQTLELFPLLQIRATHPLHWVVCCWWSTSGWWVQVQQMWRVCSSFCWIMYCLRWLEKKWLWKIDWGWYHHHHHH